MTLPENPYAYEGSAPTRGDSPPVDVIYWIPDESVTLHDGKPIPRRMVFPFPPPPEIGRVLSAERLPRWPWRGLLQQWAICSLGFSGFFLWIYFADGVKHLWFGLALVNLLVVAFVVGSWLFFTIFEFAIEIYLSWRGRPQFQSLVTYVAEEGFAIWQYSRFIRKTECRTVLFHDIEQLFEGHLVDRDGNQQYETGNMLFTVDDYEEFVPFWHEIERAWCNYYLQQWFANWNATGTGTVVLSKYQKMIVAPERITLDRFADEIVIEPKELTKLRLTYDYKLQITWRDQEAKYPLIEMPNAHAVLTILPAVLGLELTGMKLLTPTARFSIPPRVDERRKVTMQSRIAPAAKK